jgi:hypothetical protein
MPGQTLSVPQQRERALLWARRFYGDQTDQPVYTTPSSVNSGIDAQNRANDIRRLEQFNNLLKLRELTPEERVEFDSLLMRYRGEWRDIISQNRERQDLGGSLRIKKHKKVSKKRRTRKNKTKKNNKSKSNQSKKQRK